MANGDVDGGAPSDLSAGGRRLSERSEGWRVGAAGAADPQGVAGRATAQDRHAGGDERHSICCAPAARGATCPATRFRHARRSTTSSASSSVIASGRRSGPMAATMPGRLKLRWPRCRCCAWRSSSGATTWKGFVVLPRRWLVERTFSWFGRNRRLANDFENLAETLATFVTLASIQLARA